MLRDVYGNPATQMEPHANYTLGAHRRITGMGPLLCDVCDEIVFPDPTGRSDEYAGAHMAVLLVHGLDGECSAQPKLYMHNPSE